MGESWNNFLFQDGGGGGSEGNVLCRRKEEASKSFTCFYFNNKISVTRAGVFLQ